MMKSNTNGRGRYGYGCGTVDYGDRLGWWERIEIKSSTDDIPITIANKYSRRPDLLAADLYGTSTLMWVILQFNQILDVRTEFVTGAQISVPTKARVYTEILKKRQPAISED